MGYMKWIYQMIEDGSYPDFKKLYRTAECNQDENFTWRSEQIRTDFAKYIVFLVDTHLMKEYEEYIESQAELYYAEKHRCKS